MNVPRSRMRSPYMEFAKLRSGAKFNLASSGIESLPIAEFPVKEADMQLTGNDGYGFPPLLQRLARHCGVASECIVYAMGTSFANHLALAAIADPGDDILVEDPGYELIATTAQFLGLAVSTFPRRFEEQYRINVEEIAKRIQPQTRAIVLCNLHNPSGILADENSLRELIDLAQSRGIRVLVDEVYLELMFERKPPSAFHIAPETVVVTSSLTKGYGLSGLRCGWILAEPRLAERMWRINDLFAANAAHPAECLSVAALDQLQIPAKRAQRLLAANRPLLEAFLRSRDDLEWVPAPHATIVFPRLKHADSRTVERLFALATSKYETSFVPGRFFNAPQHFRIGIGGNPEMIAEALRRMGLALDQLKRG
jgi:aspartate/methionine/tyrosine aminotransferase